MTLDRGDKALTPSRLGVERLGASRLGYTPDHVEDDGAGNLLVAFRPAPGDETEFDTTWTEKVEDTE